MRKESGRDDDYGDGLDPKMLHRVLLYHVAKGTHGSQDLRYRNTLETMLGEEQLGEGEKQRVRIGLSSRGPTLNFYAVFKMFDSVCSDALPHPHQEVQS